MAARRAGPHTRPYRNHRRGSTEADECSQKHRQQKQRESAPNQYPVHLHAMIAVLAYPGCPSAGSANTPEATDAASLRWPLRPRLHRIAGLLPTVWSGWRQNQSLACLSPGCQCDVPRARSEASSFGYHCQLVCQCRGRSSQSPPPEHFDQRRQGPVHVVLEQAAEHEAGCGYARDDPPVGAARPPPPDRRGNQPEQDRPIRPCSRNSMVRPCRALQDALGAAEPSFTW